MSEQKRKRVLSAVLSGSIMLMFVFITIIVYQTITIFVRKNQIDALDQRIFYLKTQIEETENEIDKWGYDWMIEQSQREQGILNDNG